MSKKIVSEKSMSMRLVLGVTVFLHSAAAADCIKPIYAGENLWKLVARIGECLDDGLQEIESKVDAIQCSAGPQCEHVITQADIPYVITEPGIYCLVESVSNTGLDDFLITVSASNVVLDLAEFRMDGGTQGGLSEGAQDGIVVYPGMTNVTIKNGTIANLARYGVNVGSVAGNTIQTAVGCVTLENLRVLDVSAYLPSLSNVEQLDLVGSTLDSLSAVPGFDKILECCLGAQFNRIKPAVGIFVDCADQVVVNNCQVYRAQGDGFYLLRVQDALVKNSQAYNNGGNGFVFDNGDVSSVVCCKAEQNGFNGFYEVACNGDNSYAGCIAKQNGVHGFRIIGSGKTVDQCIANQNTLDGFFVVTPQNSTVDGSLDITFDGDGLVTTDVNGLGVNNRAQSLVVQKDGKIVAVGASSTILTDDNFALVRYNSDGSLDTDFNGTGIVSTNFGIAPSTDQANAVAIQEDGQIVVAGVSNATGSFEIALARYNTDGSLDTSFNSMGVVPGTLTTSFGVGTQSRANAVSIQKDGKIVVAGNVAISGNQDFAIVRYNTDGSLDTTFNPMGVLPGTVTTSFGSNIEQANAVIIQEDGKIVAVGTSNQGGNMLAIARYNMDGTLDTSFNGTGMVLADFGGATEVYAVDLQKDGAIVVAGSVNPGGNMNFFVARYNSDGTLDSSFNGTGFVVTDFGFDEQARAVKIQKDGKIVVVGYSTQEGFGQMIVARYKTDGVLDTSLNGTGAQIVPQNAFAFAGTLQYDGKVVAAGYLSDASQFALARYNIFKRPSAIQDSIAMENGRHGFNIFDAYKMTLINNVAAANACNGFIGGEPAESTLDVITKNVGDNNICADYSNIDAVILSASAGEWVNIEL